MGKFFALDSPVMNFLGKLADLIWLNILVTICCIPFVTIGASLTAMHYVLLKMVKDEESYITKSFFKSFKENFKQATIEWLILVLIFAILIGDLLIFGASTVAFPYWIRMAVIAIGVLVLFATIHLFPLQARYVNPVRATFRNSLFMGILNLPKSVLMMICWAMPMLVVVLAQQVIPLVFLLGISGPGFLNALLYKKSFQRFEPEEKLTSDMEWTVEMPGEDGTEEAAPAKEDNKDIQQ